MKYRYITFDCYGTLVDWKKGIEDSLEEVLPGISLPPGRLMAAYLQAEKEVESDYLRYKDVLRLAAIRAAKAIGSEIDNEKALNFADSLRNWPVFPDTSVSLRKLKSRGYLLYILSNVDNDQLSSTISKNSLEVDGYITAESIRSYKPSSAHWRSFMKQTGASTGEVLHAAQSIYHDIIPAQKLGIATAWVNRYAEQSNTDVKATYVVGNLMELCSLLD
jgi:2-haloacid dehalogenase